MTRTRLAFGLALLAVVAGLLAAARPAQGLSTTIVISQVYGGGGNAGATLKQDFIELFNRGTTPINVTGWSVQYASSAGTTWQKTTLAGTIQPGRYYLVGEGLGAGGTVDLPTPDATGSIAMSATAGKVALRSNDVTIASGVSCPTADVETVDFVGYGTAANCSETAPTATLSNTTAALRGGQRLHSRPTTTPPTSRSARRTRATAHAATCAGDAAPSVASTDPANNASDVAVNANVSITFSEPVNVTGSLVHDLVRRQRRAHGDRERRADDLHARPRTTDFALGETCTVTVVAAQVSDQDANDPPDTMAVEPRVQLQHRRRLRAHPRDPGRVAPLVLRRRRGLGRPGRRHRARARTASTCRTRCRTRATRPPRASSSSRARRPQPGSRSGRPSACRGRVQRVPRRLHADLRSRLERVRQPDDHGDRQPERHPGWPGRGDRGHDHRHRRPRAARDRDRGRLVRQRRDEQHVRPGAGRDRLLREPRGHAASA